MPTYETATDKTNQKRVAKYLEGCWQCRLIRLRDYEVVDYAMLALVDNSILAWVEIKAPKMTCQQFPTIMVSLHKWERAVFRTLVTGLPFYFVVGCLIDRKAIYHKYDSNLRLQVEWSGRTKRGMDNEDVEPVILIPMSRFKPVVRQEQRELL